MSHSVSPQCPDHTQYLLQPGYHLPVLSSLSFSSFWLFCSSPPPCNRHPKLLGHRCKYSILSSHFLKNCHIGALMPWFSNLPISEAQKIEGSAHHGHTSPRKLCFGANAPQHVVPARCRSPSHKANTSQAMSCLPKFWNVLDYIQIGCACSHTLFSSSCFVIFPLHQCSSAVMKDTRIIKASFYIGTFSNRWRLSFKQAYLWNQTEVLQNLFRP